MGFIIDLALAFKSVSSALNVYKPTGDLSGKTIVAIFVWAITWGTLHARWKNRSPRSTGKILAVTLVLILFSLIAVFPPFFGLFPAG